MKINLDPGQSQLDGTVMMLNLILADECLLYSKTRNCHRNAASLGLHAFRDLFEKQFDELSEIIDELAGRVRSLGAHAMGTMSEFLQYARLRDQPGKHPPAGRMIAHLLDDHQSLIRSLRCDLAADLDGIKDPDTGYFLQALIARHEKMARALQEHLANT